MSDELRIFVDEDEEEEDDTGEDISQEIEKIKVGDQEFSQEDLSRLVGLGRIAEEVETKYNTKIDRVYPEYSKGQNELKELRQYKQQIEQQKTQTPQIPEDEAIRQAKEAARKVGIVTTEDFESLVAKSFPQYYVQQRAAERLIEQADTLGGKYNGEDGRPKFDRDEIFTYMQDNGIKNPELAYKMKYEPQLDSWKEQQLSKSKSRGLVTQSTSIAGGKMPTPIKVTRDNLSQLIGESLNQQ